LKRCAFASSTAGQLPLSIHLVGMCMEQTQLAAKSSLDHHL